VIPAASRLGAGWLVAGVAAIGVAVVVGLSIGAVDLPPGRVALELADRLPLVDVDSGLSGPSAAIVWDLRAPRVVLGLLVGAMLAGAGAAYQGVFRNPLADPYLLGIAAGAGLGATLAIVSGVGDGAGPVDAVPLAAFAGALLAVAAAGALSVRRGTVATPAVLILAGVAVASFLTAIQTYVQQRHSQTIREVYSWILGRLSTSGWDEVLLLLPYAVVCAAVLCAAVGALDVMAVGDDEATSLGLRPRRVRAVVLVAASLGAAAAVAVSGLIGFVGLIVPHCVRMVAGVSNRRVVPLSMLFGAAFLALTDVVARTVQAPAELPIGVITAFIGAPFFLAILRRQAMS
jgi:iron complex transport system permease protein